MFAVEVEYLTGRAVATARHDRAVAEWPPHPGRLFSALVAACHESDLSDAERESGREALRWLERLAPPALAVSAATHRDVVPVFVPVNDGTVPEPRAGKLLSAGQLADGIKMLPERRSRQQRLFPSVTPDRSIVYFLWTQADEPGAARHAAILRKLADNLTCLGHSSSLVRASVCDDTGTVVPTYEPDTDGRHVFRVPAAGRLDELERDFARQSRPSPGTYQPYREVARRSKDRAAEARSVFGEIIVCRLLGPALPMAGTIRLTTAVRNALITHCDQASTRVRELVSGHTDDGGLSRESHIAYVPLANVGPYRFADGLIKGYGIVFPRDLGRFSAERRDILRALVGVEEIGFGAQGPWRVDVPTAGEELQSLRPGPYVGPSTTWATVTPVLCDRFPKDKEGLRIEDIIRESCVRIVGSEPISIETSPVSRHRGAPPSHTFGRIRKPGDVPRHRTHVALEFDRPVRGPILLGAGRYMGLGLFRVGGREGSR